MTADSKKALLLRNRSSSIPTYNSITSATLPLTANDDRSTDEPLLNNWQLFALTFCMIGVQFTWTVELSYGTPYLLSLHLPSSLTALVWLAGPLSGLIVQPLVGALSDKATFSWGRRRPFIIGGGIITSFSMAGVAYAKEIGLAMVTLVLGLTEDDEGFELAVQNAAIAAAVLSFYFMDFSLNAVQASCRALILDIPPLSQQERANAWAARLNGMGMVIGYFAGFLNLPKLFPLFGDHQMKVFCSIATITLLLTLLVTCFSVREKVLLVEDNDVKDSLLHTLAYIWRAFRFLPRPVQRLCNVQFFAWMGWFPFLFYSTTWVANVFAMTHDPADPQFWDKATRAGSYALFFYAIASVIAGVALPTLTPTLPGSRSPFTKKNQFTASHLLFAVAMLSTFWVQDVFTATLVIALTGIPWAIQMWVPFALIGEYIMSAENPRSITASAASTPAATPTSGHTPTHEPSSFLEAQSPNEFNAGITLGVHNMYIVFPQFAVAIISSLIFAMVNSLESPSNGDDEIFDSGVIWVLRFGGFMALFAAVTSRWIEEEQIDKTETASSSDIDR